MGLLQSSSSSASLVPCPYYWKDLLTTCTSARGLLLKMSRKCDVQWREWESFALVVTHLPCPEDVIFIQGCFREWKDTDFIFGGRDDHLGIFSLKKKKRILGTRLSSWYIGLYLKNMTFCTTKVWTKTETLLQKYFMDTIEKQSYNCHRELKESDKISWHFKKRPLNGCILFSGLLNLPCLFPFCHLDCNLFKTRRICIMIQNELYS